MSAAQQRRLPQASYIFRRELLDLLGRCTGPERFFYIDSNTCVSVCPLCDAALGVHFHGLAAAADLICLQGCAERTVLEALKDARDRR